jgi:cytochrome c-type biogenesis protein CcmF
MLLVNNVILVVACAMVLLGTIYPLIVDALGLGKLSVGPPYFNALFNPMAILLMLVLGVGSVTRWKQTGFKHLQQQLWLPGLLSLPLGFGAAWLYAGELEAWVVLSLCLSWWVVLTGVREMYNRVRHRSEKLRALLGQSRSYYGMQLAHLGVAVVVVGVALVSHYTEQRDLRMQPGDTLAFRDYTFVFEGSRHVEGPNFTADQGQIQVLYKGRPYARMNPEKRLYTARGMVMTEAAINPGFTRDLYVALGEPLENGAWAVRLQYKPYVRWIWFGALLMTAGGLLAASDPRYRKRRRTETAVA